VLSCLDTGRYVLLGRAQSTVVSAGACGGGHSQTRKRKVNKGFLVLDIFEGGLEPAGGVSSVQMGVGVGHSPRFGKERAFYDLQLPGACPEDPF
jgi:hypothetical protein